MNTDPKISHAQFGVKTDFVAIQFHEKKVGKVEDIAYRWKDTGSWEMREMRGESA